MNRNCQKGVETWFKKEKAGVHLWSDWLFNGPLGMFSLGATMRTLQKRNTMAHFIKGFLYEDALVTLKINLFIHFVVLCSRPLNVLSVIQPERLGGTETLWHHWWWTHSATRWPHQNDNVIMSKAIMFTLLLLINNVDDGVNKGYCGIFLGEEWFLFCESYSLRCTDLETLKGSWSFWGDFGSPWDVPWSLARLQDMLTQSKMA